MLLWRQEHHIIFTLFQMSYWINVGVIKNEHSKDTGNIRHKTQIKDKQSKTSLHKKLKISNMDPTKLVSFV